jgi:hypothetical protein
MAQALINFNDNSMPEFDRYVMRHGEFWVQNIVETIERSEGIRPGYAAPLEQRWNVVMRLPVAAQQSRKAA